MVSGMPVPAAQDIPAASEQAEMIPVHLKPEVREQLLDLSARLRLRAPAKSAVARDLARHGDDPAGDTVLLAGLSAAMAALVV